MAAAVKSKFVFGLISLAAVAMGVTQVALEGFHWQMTFAYFGLFLLLAKQFIGKPGLAKTETELGSKKIPTSQFAKLAFILLAISLCFAIAVPIAELPAPHGPYGVGTQTYPLSDNKRREIFSNDANQKRELVIQIWYPTQANLVGKVAPFMQESNNLSPFLSAPLFAILASHLHFIKTHSLVNAPIAASEKTYPLLIFSHGVLGGRIQNTVQAEELASHGYIVAGIDHTYDSAFAIFPDKTIPSQLITSKLNSVSLVGDSAMTQRRQDVQFVLDELQKLSMKSSSNELFRRIDFNEVGVFGHSLGGQTAMLVCSKDDRFKAGLSMDGFRSLPPGAIRQPFMFIQADQVGSPIGIYEYLKPSTGPHYCLKLQHAQHANFTDLPLITPLHWIIGMSGDINASRAMNVIDDYSLAFFNRYLKHAREDLLDCPSPKYPEMKFEKDD